MSAAGRRLLEEGQTRRTSALERQLSSLSPEELATLREAAALMERLSQER
jgi:hypothetical protein